MFADSAICQHRRSGVSAALVEAAIAAARRRRAAALEAYPFDRALSTSSTSSGFASTFARAGFAIGTRHVPARPIMHRDLRRGTNTLGC